MVNRQKLAPAHPESAPVQVFLPNEAATEALGATLANWAKMGDIITLSGDLGMGKTSLARGFVRACMGYEIDVPSPTFTLIQIYDTPRGTVWHTDLYRLRTPEESQELGLEEGFATAVTLLEWPDRMGSFLPAQRLDIVLESESTGRRALLKPYGAEWTARLKDVPL